jgi:LmbE family N-acetylglucosaminyl deacetylase
MQEIEEKPPLIPLTEDWQRGLAIVAHPDDLEFGPSAAIARWTGQGKEINYCLLTRGEASIEGMPPEQAGPVREQEERAAATIVGVKTVDFLGFPDGELEFGLPMRRAMVRALRRYRPEIVITINFRETWDGGTILNQNDHIATGRGVIDAVFDARQRWVFRDLYEKEGLDSWRGVRQIWAAGSPDARHGVDITDTFERGIASLKAHQSYLQGLPETPVEPEDFLEGICLEVGTRLDCEYGDTFEAFPVEI